MKNGFEKLDSFAKRTSDVFIRQIGLVTGAITVFVCALLFFTDISMMGIGTKELTGNFITMILASYIMYFSLSDSGELLGRESAEYLEAAREYGAVRDKIGGESLPALSLWCCEYADGELLRRRRRALLAASLSEEDYAAYLDGRGNFSSSRRRALRACSKMKRIKLTPSMLLSEDAHCGEGLTDPRRSKLLARASALIPTLVCSVVTVSVSLSAKDAMTYTTAVAGLLKLFGLFVVGVKGYYSGYKYSRYAVTLWFDRRRQLLEAYLSSHPVNTGANTDR